MLEREREECENLLVLVPREYNKLCYILCFILCTRIPVVTVGERCILDRLEEEAKRESARALLAEGQSLDVVGQITVIPCSRGSTCLRPDSSDINRFDINGICTRFNNSRDSELGTPN